MTIEQWNEAFQLAGGFQSLLDYVLYSTKESIIIAQKQSSIKLPSIQRQETWIIFSDQHDTSVGTEMAIKLRDVYAVENITLVYLKKSPYGIIDNLLKHFCDNQRREGDEIGFKRNILVNTIDFNHKNRLLLVL